jgi:hypothetical protein
LILHPEFGFIPFAKAIRMYLNANLMKKLVLAISFAFCLHFLATAQLENLRLGFQVSPSMSWISTNDQEINRTSSSVGISVGAIAEYFMTEQLSFTGGIGLAFNKGGTLQHEHGGNLLPNSELSNGDFNTGVKPLADNVKIKYKLQYIELPFAIKLRTEEKGYFRYFAELPIVTLGMRVQARGDIKAEGDVLHEEIDVQKENITGDVNFFNVQLGLGAGLEYAISENTSLVGGLYFHAGITDVTGNDGKKAINNPDNTPGNPNDNYIIVPEDSYGRLSSVTLRIAIMF